MSKRLLISLILFGIAFPQSGGGDILNESPLTPIPEEMTFEEYRDMNRRLTFGMALTSIPIPGLIHDYAGEKKTAKRIRRVALGSIGLIIAGAAMTKEDEGEWPESKYTVYIEGEGDSEIRYEMIPTGMVGSEVSYDLKPMEKKYKEDGGGGLLVMLGIGLLVADVIYDVYHGTKVIEEKRDAVRYKYGKQINFSYSPEMNMKTQYAGLKINYDF